MATERVLIVLENGETVERTNGSWGRAASVRHGDRTLGFEVSPDGSLVIQQSGLTREAFARGTWESARFEDDLPSV
jgi:hypothetical protein